MSGNEIVNWGGVKVDKAYIETLGERLDDAGTKKFFIDFKDGKKVEYYDQRQFNNEAEIKYGGLGSMCIFDLKVATVKGSPNHDSFVLDNCQTVNLDLYDGHDSKQTVYNKSDNVEVRDNCKSVRVRGDKNDIVNDYTKPQNHKIEETEVYGGAIHQKWNQ